MSQSRASYKQTDPSNEELNLIFKDLGRDSKNFLSVEKKFFVRNVYLK